MYTLPSSSLATLPHCPNWDRRIPSFVEVRNEVLKANKFCDQQLATTAARNEFSRATARAAARDRQRSVSGDVGRARITAVAGAAAVIIDSELGHNAAVLRHSGHVARLRGGKGSIQRARPLSAFSLWRAIQFRLLHLYPPHRPPNLRVGGLFAGLVGSLMNRHFEIRIRHVTGQEPCQLDPVFPAN